MNRNHQNLLIILRYMLFFYLYCIYFKRYFQMKPDFFFLSVNVFWLKRLYDVVAWNAAFMSWHTHTISTKSMTRGQLVIFQSFINEHNLWGTTAVLALSVHATVENNNLEFLLFRFSLFFFRHPSSFSVSHVFYFFYVFFFSLFFLQEINNS